MNTNCNGDNTENRGTRGWAVLSSTELLFSAFSWGTEVAISLIYLSVNMKIESKIHRNSWLSLSDKHVSLLAGSQSATAAS